MRYGRQRVVSPRRRDGRRHLLGPLGLHRHSESRTVDVDDEHRPHAGRPPIDRFVADLRSWHRQQEPAGLRRALSGRADDGRSAVVEQRVPASGASGYFHPR
jgi:hypothetical protein